jgi:predicted nucleic acid-binding protein
MRRYLLHNRPGAVALMTNWVRSEEAATSSLVYGEVIEHIMGRPNYPAHRDALRAMLRAVHTYLPTYGVLERYAALRRQLRPPYGPGLIGDIDTLIAATAIEHGLTVVTLDADYQRVPGLNVMLLSLSDLT